MSSQPHGSLLNKRPPVQRFRVFAIDIFLEVQFPNFPPEPNDVRIAPNIVRAT